MRQGSKTRSHRGANGGTSRLRPGQVWIGHCGKRAQERYLRQSWDRIEKLCAKDNEARLAREVLLDSVQDEPYPEYTALHLGHTALMVSQEDGIPWAEAITQILSKAADNAEAEPPEHVLGVGPDGMPPTMRARLLAREARA